MENVELPKRVKKEIDWRNNFICTDAGRMASGNGREKNDCTIRALALCEDIPYIAAKILLQPLRISPKRGVRGLDLEAFLDERGYRKMPLVKKTLKSFVDFYKGTYYLIFRRHALCVKGGKFYDTFTDRPGARIQAVYEII